MNEKLYREATAQAFAPETRKYCNFLETAALETENVTCNY